MKNDWINKQVEVYSSEDSEKYFTNLPFGEATRATHTDDLNYWRTDKLLKHLNKGDKILDAACNDGGLVHFLRSKGYNTFGVDLPKIVAMARKRYPKIGQFLEPMNLNENFPNKKFNIIYASSIIEHLYNDYYFLLRSYLHLEVDGKLIMIYPDGINAYPNHIRIYTREMMKKLTGIFGIVEIDYESKRDNICQVFQKKKDNNDLFSKEDWITRQNYEISAWGDGSKLNTTESKYTNANKFKVFPQTDFSDKIVLDIGAGPQGMLNNLKSNITIALEPLLQDYDNKNWKIRENNYAHIIGTGEKIPLINNYVDYVFCFNSLSHTLDPPSVIREMQRVLNDDGEIWFYHNLADRKMDFHLKYTGKDYTDMLTKGDFEKIFTKQREVDGAQYLFAIFKKKK